MTDLTRSQRRRLVELARAGKSLLWTPDDTALREAGLVQRYTAPFDGAFADLTGKGSALAHRIARER